MTANVKNVVDTVIHGITTACMLTDIGTAAAVVGADHILRVLEQDVGFCTKELREDLGLDFKEQTPDESASVKMDDDSVTLNVDRIHIKAEMSQCGGAGEACSDYTPQQLKMASELLLDMISKNIAGKKI